MHRNPVENGEKTHNFLVIIISSVSWFWENYLTLLGTVASQFRSFGSQKLENQSTWYVRMFKIHRTSLGGHSLQHCVSC
jgi:hypothetical protein